MSQPSMESCERDLVALVQRDLADPEAHAALVRWYHRSGRPVRLDAELFRELARRWLAGETTPGLSDLLLADQGLGSWQAGGAPPAFWVEGDRAKHQHGCWIDRESGLPLRLRRLPDGAPLVLIPSGPSGYFYAAVRPFTFADLLKVGGAVSAGVRSEDLADEAAPAYRITARAEERLLKWCRGQCPSPREWWIAVLGVDPGNLLPGELPDPGSPAGLALVDLTRGLGAISALAHTPLGLEDVTLTLLPMGQGELTGGLRSRIAHRPHDLRVPGDHRRQLRLRGIHRVEAILRAVHDLANTAQTRIRRRDRPRIDLLPRRRGLGGWLRDLIRPPTRADPPLPAPPPPRCNVSEWHPPELEREQDFPDRTDPGVFANTIAAVASARKAAVPGGPPEDLLVAVLRPLVAARRGHQATASIPGLGDTPAVDEDPLVGTRYLRDRLMMRGEGAASSVEDLAAAALALAELRQPLAFVGITEVYLELAVRLPEVPLPGHGPRLALLRARDALLRDDLPAARAALASPAPEGPEERFRWDLARARAHRDMPERALEALPLHETGVHRGGELAFLRGAASIAAGVPDAAIEGTPKLVEGDLARVPTRCGLALPALDLALLALAQAASGNVAKAWAAAHQARDLSLPWVARRRRVPELNLLARLDCPPSGDPHVLCAQLAALVDTLTHPACLRDLPGYLMLEASRRAADLRWAAGLLPAEAPIARRARSLRLHVLEDGWYAWVARLREDPRGYSLLREALASRLPPPEPGLHPLHPEVPSFPDPGLEGILGGISYYWPDGDEV